MVIIRSIEEHGNLFPSFVNLVNSLPEDVINIEPYGYRHPSLISRRIIHNFYYSAYKVFEFNDLMLKEWVNGDENSPNNLRLHTEMENAIVSFFHTISSYIDDCFNLFKITSPVSKYKPINAVQWLEKNKHPYFNEFFLEFVDYHNDLKKIINEIKHQNGRLNISIGLTNNGENFLCYSLPYMGKTKEGKYAEIHDLNQLRTLELDLKSHFYNFYYISEVLGGYMEKSLNYYYDLDIEIKKNNGHIDYFHKEVFERMSKKEIPIMTNNEKFFAIKPYILFNENTLEVGKIGLNEKNQKFSRAYNIKGLDKENNKILIIPKTHIIDKINNDFLNLKVGESNRIEFLDTPENVHKIIFKRDVENGFCELNFDEKIIVRSDTKWLIQFAYTSGLNNETINIIPFDYKKYVINN